MSEHNEAAVNWLPEELRKTLNRVSNGHSLWDQVFTAYWLQQVGHLTATITRSDETKEFSLRCEDFHGSARSVLDSVAASGSQTVEDVWVYSKGEPLLSDAPWRRYFKHEAQLAEADRLTSIRSLMVLPDVNALKETQMRQLLQFYKGNAVYSCRWLLVSEYDAIRSDAAVQYACVDFAVYGRDLVFITTGYEPSQGKFLAEPESVAKYRALFEALWDAGTNPMAIVAADPPLSLAELVSLDARARGAAS